MQWSSLPEVEIAGLEDLRQSKVYLRYQKRQYKEMKELVKKHQKKAADMVKEHVVRYGQAQHDHNRRRNAMMKAAKRDGKKR